MLGALSSCTATTPSSTPRCGCSFVIHINSTTKEIPDGELIGMSRPLFSPTLAIDTDIGGSVTRSSLRLVATRLGVVATLLAAAVVAGGGFGPTAAFAVANGQDVPDGQYRFSAALSMPLITRPNGSTYSSACSGALVAPRW